MSDEILEKTAATNTVSSPLSSPGNMGAISGGAHSSNLAGGVLLPEQSTRFLDYIFDNMVLANDGRRVTMRANTAEFDKVQVGSRLITKATQADQTGTNASAVFTKVDVVTTKFRLDYELSTEALEDNIEGGGLEDHIVRLMASQFGNDLEDIAINGTSASATAANEYINTIDGFVKLVKAAAAGNNHFGAAGTFATASTYFTGGSLKTDTGSAIQFFENLYNALDRKYKARRQELKFYASTKNIQTLLTDLRKIGSGGVPEATAANVLAGTPARVGGAAGYATTLFGIPVVEVPLYPDSYVDLTFPSNRIWGFQRDVTVHREFQPKKDTVEYTVYVRMGVNIEEGSAFAKGNS